MIVVNGENLRIFSIMVLSVIWFYLLTDYLASESLDDED